MLLQVFSVCVCNVLVVEATSRLCCAVVVVGCIVVVVIINIVVVGFVVFITNDSGVVN